LIVERIDKIFDPDSKVAVRLLDSGGSRKRVESEAGQGGSSEAERGHPGDDVPIDSPESILHHTPISELMGLEDLSEGYSANVRVGPESLGVASQPLNHRLDLKLASQATGGEGRADASKIR
jgi:hypothetical protein